MILILSSALVAIPAIPSGHSTAQPFQSNSPITSPRDPNGALTAFNYTYSQANLYTNTSSPPPSSSLPANTPGVSFLWQSTANRTKDNSRIPGSGFQFNLTSASLPTNKEIVNWTLTIPQFNCNSCSGVSVEFNFFGKITLGSNASYAVYNGTRLITTPNNSQAFTASGPFPSSSVIGCPENFCVNVSSYVGWTINLVFKFGWNGTNSAGMFADVGEIVVAAIGNFLPSSSNSMIQDSTNSTNIIHTTTLSTIAYNNTLKTTLHPGGTSQTTLWWHIEIISIYYPVGYNITQVSFNSTKIFPAPPFVPFETEHCNNGSPPCSQSLIAFNVADFTNATLNSSMTIISNTRNSIHQVTPVELGIPTSVFTPGDQIGIKTVNMPTVVNASTSQQTGNYSVTFVDPSGTRQPLTALSNPATTLSGGVFNFTLPSGNCGSTANLCGKWTSFVVFTSGLDMGNMSSTFRIDQIRLTSFSSSGSNTGLTVNGVLAYANTSSAATNGVIFAVDQETPTNVPVTTQGTPSSGLYVANVSLLNGIFTQGQSLIMTFTLINPASAIQTLNANVTIEHEWPGSQTHGVNVTFPVGLRDGLGDVPFNSTFSQGYETTFTLTTNGTMVKFTSLNTLNSKTTWMSIGTSPVVLTRPHAGLFKITVTSKTGGTSAPIESPPYAYVYGLNLPTPSKYLAYSSTFTTNATSGSFSLSMKSDSILGAAKLTVFALARDSSGIVLVNNQSPGFSDFTGLESSMDSIGQVAEGQSVTATLHLKSNATKITEIITVDLNLQGSGKKAEQTGISIAPGASQDVTLSFKAPSSTGQYTLSFSSPQYPGLLASQTLQVTILQSDLQILIPAAIGIVAAIIILGFYLVRSKSETGEVEEKTKPAVSKPKPPGPGSSPSKSLTRTPESKD
jgi:hypothetical protein